MQQPQFPTAPIKDSFYDPYALPGLDEYFKVTPPENWHPNNYCNKLKNTHFLPFLEGLGIISACRDTSSVAPNLSIFARKILQYLKTPPGKSMCEAVEQRLKSRRQQQQTVVAYRDMQNEYMRAVFERNEEDHRLARTQNEEDEREAKAQRHAIELSSPSITERPHRRKRQSRRVTDPYPHEKGGQAKSRMMAEPWHNLTNAAIEMYLARSVRLPESECAKEEKDKDRRRLYKIAYQELEQAREDASRPKYNRSSCLHFKNAFVALSNVWNLFSPEANSMFTKEECTAAHEITWMPDLEMEDPIMKKLIDDVGNEANLSKAMDMLFLQMAEFPSHRPFLLALMIILKNVIRPHHGMHRPSEGDAMQIWGDIFKFGVPDLSPFNFRLGEQGSASAALSKTVLTNIFDTGINAT